MDVIVNVSVQAKTVVKNSVGTGQGQTYELEKAGYRLSPNPLVTVGLSPCFKEKAKAYVRTLFIKGLGP